MTPNLSLSNEDFDFLRSLIREETGIVLSDQKRALLAARLQQRLRALRLKSFHQYCLLLRSAGRRRDELPNLVNRITTNETYFYRFEKHFEFLRREILVKQEGRDLLTHPIRIWSAGCSSGEEPYTLAMLAQEIFPQAPPGGVRILGTDIDTEMLRHAREGAYPRRKLRNLPRPWRRNYFDRTEKDGRELFRVRPALRKFVAFRRHNLLKDPPPVRGKADCVFCRNVLIYFSPKEQERAVQNLVAALRPGGYLFLGHSESLVCHPQLQLLQHAVFRKREDDEPAV